MLMPSWPIGSLASALITWGTFTGLITNWSWRIPSLLQCFFPIVQIVIAFFGPESPRWLIDKGRDQEAIDFFVKYHAHGDADHPIVQFEFAEIAATIEEEKLQKVGSWLTWFSSKAMLHRLFLALAVPAFQ
jgi:MFS family permease